MSSIFAGMIFIFVNFSINMGDSVIGLIPSFIGYILIAKGLTAMREQSERFSRAYPLSVIMAVYTAATWLFDLLGFSALFGGVLPFLLGMVAVTFQLVISYHIVMGVKSVEERLSVTLEGAALCSAWKVQAVVSVLVFLLSFIPVVNIIAILLAFVISIVFLVRFSRSKNLYNSMSL